MNVLLLALSNMRLVNKGGGRKEIVSSKFYLDEEIEYYYQLEPVPRFLEKKGHHIDRVVYFATKKTDKDSNPETFFINGKEITANTETFFKDRIEEIFENVNYIPVYDKGSDVSNIKYMMKKIRELHDESQDDFHLWIDIHGGLRPTQMLIQSVVTLLKYEGITPEDVYSIEYDEANKRSYLVKASNTHDIHGFVAGMNEFITYGKSKLLEEFAEKFPDQVNKELVKHIKSISDAIQLCDIQRFDEAIVEMDDFINSDDYNDIENTTYSDIFVDTIISVYEKILPKDTDAETDVIDKVEWCLEHDFIQQALTVIESQMPEEFFKKGLIKWPNQADQPDQQLESALNDSKESWEKKENYAFFNWIKFNVKINADENWVNPLLIREITDYDQFQKIDMDEVAFDNSFRVRPRNSNSINMTLTFPDVLTEGDGKKKLTKLFRLHLALKDQRNQSNHASTEGGNERATVDQVKIAIQEYIKLTTDLYKILFPEKVDK